MAVGVGGEAVQPGERLRDGSRKESTPLAER